MSDVDCILGIDLALLKRAGLRMDTTNHTRHPCNLSNAFGEEGIEKLLRVVMRFTFPNTHRDDRGHLKLDHVVVGGLDYIGPTAIASA